MNRFVRLVPKKRLHPLLSILKNPLNIAPHEKPVDERPAARPIANGVQTERAPIALHEGVRVMPQGVRATQLPIHELVRRIPFGDFGSPANGQSMHPNPVVNECAGPHCYGAGRQHLEV